MQRVLEASVQISAIYCQEISKARPTIAERNDRNLIILSAAQVYSRDLLLRRLVSSLPRVDLDSQQDEPDTCLGV